MSRQENRNHGEKQQKKNGNKHTLTSLAPPTEQIAFPAVNFVKYTCCSHSILLSCCFFSRKMSQKRLRFTAEQVRAVHFGGAFESMARDFGIPRLTLRRRLKCPFPRRMRGQATFSKDEEETMATVVKGFETMNLPLTRRKFLSIVKKEKERKSEFCLRNCYCWSKVQCFCAAVQKGRVCAFFPL